MGVVLYGQNPKSEEGKVLRQSIWVWSPLINYFQIEHDQISSMMHQLQFNDAFEVGPNAAQAIADIIDEDMKNGKIEKYINDFKKMKEDLPDMDCQHCLGKGKEREFILYESEEDCFRCKGSGKSRPLIDDYFVELFDFTTFQNFIRESEGFIIN